MYLITVLALILTVFSAQIHPLYHTEEWKTLRSAIFCSVAAYGIIPACHWVWLNGGFHSEIVQVRIDALIQAGSGKKLSEYERDFSLSLQVFFPRVMVMYLIAASAFLFYISKVPERYFPGKLSVLCVSLNRFYT